ncbi:MAG: hypothetical protein LUC37_06785 [Prevotella sp.]|nr:hypothetical protein [Prevotella sp.]
MVFDDTDDEPQMLKNFYNYVVAFIKTDFDLEAVYAKVEEFVVWCDDNRTRLQNDYGVKISIDK